MKGNGKGMTRDSAGRRRATLADVARLAGVSEITASRVLRSQGPISATTRERVLTAVAELGYVPNRIAGTLASAGSRLVGIVIPSLSNIVFPEVLRGANDVLEAAGYQSVVGVTDYDLEREERLIASFLAWRPRGLLISGLEHSERGRLLLLQAGIPIVELLDTDGRGVDSVVGFSNREAGQAAARHLLARGYRRFGYVGHDLEADRRAFKRYEGFWVELASVGQRWIGQEIVPQRSSVEAGRAALARLLRRVPDLDAVYFSNDDMAIGGYFHCLAEGLAVPGQVALFGHNGLEIGRALPQPLSTIRTPRAEIGAEGARLLLGDAPRAQRDLGFTLLEGATA